MGKQRTSRSRVAAAAAAVLAMVALRASGLLAVARAQVKLSRLGICHSPGGAYWERTLHFTPHPSIESCLATGGRHPKRGQGDCDAPAAAQVSAVPSGEDALAVPSRAGLGRERLDWGRCC